MASEIPRSSPLARLLKWGVMRWWRINGWTVGGAPLPDTRKFIIAGAPHTSNYDFLVFLGVVETLGLTPRYIGKHSLFRWPMRDFMMAMGGVPVDRRRQKKGMVQQVAARIAEAEEFALVIAVEGTRSPTTEWRTGYYRIAEAAGIPIVCAGPDYERREGLIGPTIWPTGDLEKDMAPAIAFFKSLRPRYPEMVLFPDGNGLDPQLQAERQRARMSAGTGGNAPTEVAP
ncbi:1-acyl-sn-glycerol-3-phosphate acyltransferase [Sphingomicrobium sp. XHP0239]|uniref:1-acyl-sn-glycerol-3-phosphate acyltransferase n=1 Tax=Sphingomicrobium maritimum TaxID=3133972 RepID=UPI0031CC7355